MAATGAPVTRDMAAAGPTRRRLLLFGGLLGGAALATAACGNITTPAGASGTSGASPLAAAAAPGAGSGPQAFLYLTISSPAGTGRPDYPAYTPSYFTVPANTLLQVQITCFDSGPATVPAGYEKVTGAAGGTMDVFAATVGDLSKLTPQTLAALPQDAVVHTFTVPELNLNVPVPGTSTVRFLYQTGAPGTHAWQCMAACGTGSSGWSGPMAEAGYMQGVMTVGA
jgi:hypothetical protein